MKVILMNDLKPLGAAGAVVGSAKACSARCR
jgi:hypothetical protein